MIWFILLSVLAICLDSRCQIVTASTAPISSNPETNYATQKHARRKLDDIGGNINIDCGIPDDSTDLDPKTGPKYTSDQGFIDTGVNKNISSNFSSDALPKTLLNVRSFPQGNRNCYTLKPPEGKSKIYLIRASFMYGNYDDQNSLPEFHLYVGVNEWDSVKFDNASHIVIKEIIHRPEIDDIYLCLLNNGSGTPFISAIEVRHYHNSTYRIEAGSTSLVLYQRLDFGSTSNEKIRFPDDVYDRIWSPYNCHSSASINTTSPIDSVNGSDFHLPSKVMQTAARPRNVNNSLNFEFDVGDPTLYSDIYLHFAELENLQGNQHREFNILLNGKPLKEGIVLSYLQSTTITSPRTVRGAKLSFSLNKSEKSTLPPILNAMEIYTVRDFLQAPTDQADVNALKDIKGDYSLSKVWQGDPCAPERYAWDGINCSYRGYDSPKIISLNLSSSGLTGQMSSSFSELKSLQHLDLSNNSLTGPLPDFLSELPNLRTLNLEENKLSGAVPMALIERSNNGSLSLSLAGNLELCQSPPCKEGKKTIAVTVIVASVVPVAIILIALVVFWIYRKRRKAPHTDKFLMRNHGFHTAAQVFVNSKEEEGSSLKLDNRQFTYNEIIRITNNFHIIIGKGGFGTVYRGYLADSTPVAVKMLSSTSPHASSQFRTEAQLLMRVHHRNLASFIGYCKEGTNIGIIYEYMACGDLADYLSDYTKEVLSLKERLQIALDAAQGLEYLHHGCKPPIIHRDVKSANILLNERLQAKMTDFGLSKLFPIESGSHLSTMVAGTIGYLDPEYYTSNRLTEKSDVYSFGVVLLELITGRSAIIKNHDGNINIVDWVGPFLERGDLRNVVDQRLEGNFDTNSAWKFIEIAMSCVPSFPIQRPAMNQVVVELKECLAAEIAREQTSGTEGRMLRSGNSLDMSIAYLETEMGPEAR